MEIKCLIVDDEELALNVLEKFIATIPTLKLVGKCDNAVEAITFLHNNKVDLLFLDINMPELSGLDMLKTFTNPPKVILTTAYSEYALESYEYGVIDYLLKPIKLERFIKAVNKVVELLGKKQKNIDETVSETEKSIFVKEDSSTYQVLQNEINYIEAYGNYLKIHTTKKTYITRETMLNILGELSELYFIRVHKSFTVNLNKIDKIFGNTIQIGVDEIPIGNSYKSEVLKKIKS
jgi:two-component system, LytTR family, response regulator